VVPIHTRHCDAIATLRNNAKLDGSLRVRRVGDRGITICDRSHGRTYEAPDETGEEEKEEAEVAAPLEPQVATGAGILTDEEREKRALAQRDYPDQCSLADVD
jgi:hypothetical protein